MGSEAAPKNDSNEYDREALYLSLVENLPVSVARKDVHGRITFANQAFCGLLGITPEEVLGKTDYDLYPKELADKYRHDDLWVQKHLDVFSDVEQNYSAGETRYFEVRKTPILNKRGEVNGTQVIFWDVSAHKRVKAELDQERQLLNALLANTPDNIYFKDLDGRYIRISQAKAKRLALNHPLDAVGKTDSEFFDSEQVLRARQDEQSVIQTGRSLVSKEEEIAWPNGTNTWVSTTKAPLRNFVGDIIGTFGISRDITSRKLFEEAQEAAREAAEAANQAKSDFLAHMSHEIRTPMNAILGLTDLVLATKLDETQRDYLTTVLASSESLLSIINQILDFSKIDAHKMELESIPFSFGTWVKDTMKALEFRANQKGIELIAKIHPDVPDEICGDPTRLRQVIVNLISNAIKFTDEGNVTVAVSSAEENQRIRLIFSVSDTGIGIPEEKIGAIFDEFQQADSSTSRHFGGTGLGLSISARLVELMGGTISAESKSGTGSTFRFNVLLDHATEDQKQQLRADQTTPTTITIDKSSVRVLLAEDGLANQKLMVGLLERMGFSVHIANNGREAVELYTSEPFDLVLMDVQMPEVDGLEASALIRQQESRTGKPAVPIIAITAHASQADRQKCLDAGMDDFLSKPLRKHELLTTIKKYCDVNLPNPENQSESSDSEWSLSAALEAVDGDKDLLIIVINAFLGECDDLLAQMNNAIESNELPILRRAAHTIKGATRIFDSKNVFELARKIELAAADNQQTDYASLGLQLQKQLDQLKAELKLYVDQNS